jgi:hypothetical protein
MQVESAVTNRSGSDLSTEVRLMQMLFGAADATIPSGISFLLAASMYGALTDRGAPIMKRFVKNGADDL